jgi:HEPN domain-containing protein
VAQLVRITDEVHSDSWGGNIGVLGQRLRPLFKDLYLRAFDELKERFYLCVPTENERLYKQPKPLFGDAVDASFPLAAEDISEAGKCLALGRATASVFHLMRAMESAIQALSARLGVQNIEREWGKLLSDINDKIAAMPKGSERDKWSENSSQLYHVKQAWRNNTMHPKQTYSEEEARKIFEAVNVFMTGLAALI